MTWSEGKEDWDLIDESNNNYDLSQIFVQTPGAFGPGETLEGHCDGGSRWLVHRRDATTLLIAPLHRPDAWEPAHIYGIGGHVDA